MLKSNYKEALRRLKCTERQLEKKPDKKDKYEKAIMEYVEMGFARELSKEESSQMLKEEHYVIPHHAVSKKPEFRQK